MRQKIALLFAVIVWFAVIAQLVLMIQNRVASIPETIIRFFSFFTILTNLLVAFYFTSQALKRGNFNKPGVLTAITVYITIVGLVYQVLLRHIWQPTGLQLVVDELLHTINPLIVVLFWYLYEKKDAVKYSQIRSWLIYPAAYLVYVLIRGSLSAFYPYPFINVARIGTTKTLLNSSLLLAFFIVTAFIFVAVGKGLAKKRTAFIKQA